MTFSFLPKQSMIKYVIEVKINVGGRMSNRIIKGTLILTIAGYISRFLGMIYVIPFNALVGAQGVALYSYAYIPYTVLISLSTVGIPPAISKMVAKYNALEDYKTGLRVFRISFFLMIVTGFMAFLALYFSAQPIAEMIISSKEAQGNTVEDVTKVIQMVSFALIIIPAMSAVRGFFQGNQTMVPTAVSQVVEQIVRITFVLTAGFIIVVLYDGSYATAVSFATFAAFIGALGSVLVLLKFWQTKKQGFYDAIEAQQTYYHQSLKGLLYELFSYAIPFILVGIATPLYQLVDLFTFNRAMEAIGLGSIAELSFAAIHFNGNKLIVIPVMVATGMSLTLVPALTESYTNQRYDKLAREINLSIQIVLFLVIPAVFGLIALSSEAYGSLFSMEDLSVTSALLAWNAPLALFLALFTVSSAILQGINEQRFAVFSLFVGFIVKLTLNSFLIHTFGAKGSIFATGLAVGAATFVNLWRIKHCLQLSFIQTYKRGLFMFIFSGIMYLGVVAGKGICSFFLPFDTSRIAATVMLLIGVMLGIVIYFFLTYKSTLLDAVLGTSAMMEKIRRKFGANR